MGSSPTDPLPSSCLGSSRSCIWYVASLALRESECLGPLSAWNSWQPTVCVCACVGANPSNICQALCDPGSFWLQGWDGWVHRGHVCGGQLACARAPCARQSLCEEAGACTHMAHVAKLMEGTSGTGDPSKPLGSGIQGSRRWK